MALTALTILLFAAIGFMAITAGHFMEKPEIYVAGCMILLFMGIVVADDGMREKTGESIEETTDGGNTSTTVTNVYEDNKSVVTNGISALLMLVGAGAALTFWVARRREKEERMQDPDFIQ